MKKNRDVFVLARKIFSEHIKRSVKYGLRSEKSIINDYLVNQAYVGLSMKQLIKWEKNINSKFILNLQTHLTL